MRLQILDDALESVRKNPQIKEFSSLIREARKTLGLKLYKAAFYIGITPARLKNLEIGFYRNLPHESEFTQLSKLYNIPYATLHNLAARHVKEHKRRMNQGDTL